MPIPASCTAGSKVLSTGPCCRGSLGSPLKNHRAGSPTEFASSLTSALRVGSGGFPRESQFLDGWGVDAGQEDTAVPMSPFVLSVGELA